MMVMLIVTIVSGQGWTTYWGPNFNSFADKVTPGEPVDPPASTSSVAIWSVISAFVMYWKRRRAGSTGLPRRPVDVKLSKRLVWIALAIGIIYPQWGVSALIVLGLDRFVIRRVRPLTRAFGQA